MRELTDAILGDFVAAVLDDVEPTDYCLDHGDPVPCGSCGQGDISEEDTRSHP